MKSGLFQLLICLACYGAAQTAENFDKDIGQHFTKSTERSVSDNKNSNITSSHTSINLKAESSGGDTASGTGSCKCVPYYLCKEGTIVTVDFGLIDSRTNIPCNYLSVCCNPPDVLEKPRTPPPDLNRPKGCGVRNPNGIGLTFKGNKDNEAQFGEFPWMVAVLGEEVIEEDPQKVFIYQCGASLIHPQVVMTSAHCVSGKDKKYKVRAGEWDTQTKKELFPYQERDVTTILSHPEYYAKVLFYDVALLILNSTLEIIDNVGTVCLPKQDEIVENTNCFINGWGKHVFEREGKYTVILKKIELPIVQKGVCQDSLRTTLLGQQFKLHETFLCAGGEDGKDTCDGDGGSPLVCPIPDHPGRYFQAGIFSWRIGCGENQIPSVYANIPKFITWINEQLAAYKFESSYYTY